jgi:murein DD-endopeptidase MepM/ murein hydrolase activator NlpD
LKQAQPLKRSRFTDLIVQYNALDETGFDEWVFCPGMLFNAGHKWWGDRATREKSHEGLDLLLYRNNKGEFLHLGERAKVPSLYDGTVVRVIDDFLGKSIFMEHSMQENRKLITAFGHIRPVNGIETGKEVKEGDIIANITDVCDNEIKIAPHLHMNEGWISGNIEYESLEWSAIGTSDMITLVDPLEIIGGDSDQLKDSSPACKDL